MKSIKNLFETLLAQDKAARTGQQILAFAGAGNIGLSKMEMAMFSEGEDDGDRYRRDFPPVSVCPMCGSTNVAYYYDNYLWYAMHNRCRDCGWKDI